MFKDKHRMQRRGQTQEAQPNPAVGDMALDVTPATVPVVGICSSAGGLAALTLFFKAAPAECGAAFVVVPHLDPTHESLMVELLSRHTAMEVRQAQDGVKVEANKIYVIPPNRNLAMQAGCLKLSVPGATRRAQTAIDAFLRSLASDQRERAIAIILSGTGSHGALGIKEIKLAGGMVMAQDPESAEYDAMPRSAIGTGLVDHVMRPEKLPGALADYLRHPYLQERQQAMEFDSEGQELNHILAMLLVRTKYDFRCYRRNMLLRRVQRRMGLCQVQSLAEYQVRLRENPEEITALYRDLLISVTAFFRDPEAFQLLEHQVIPELIGRMRGDMPLRLWIPASATGEEAYSIGMLLIEALEAANRPCDVQIFATDLDEQALELARHGIYPDTIAGDLSEQRLRRFFVPYGENSFQVHKQLRDLIVFAQQSVIGDAPFSRIDMISCRNLLIYLEPSLQAKVIRLFHFALNQRGYLLLGPSESIGREANLFEVVSKKWRVYQRIGPTRHDLVDIPITGSTMPRPVPLAAVNQTLPAGKREGIRLSELTHRMLLADYAPASVLINRRFEIFCHQGATVNYLEFPSGEPSSDLLALSRPGLRTRIRAALQSAEESQETVVDGEARVKRDGQYVACRITVRLARELRGTEGLFLVSFEDLEQLRTAKDTEQLNAPQAAPSADETRVIEQLENELQATREDLQSTIEELESSNEELKASNEEIMSMNEELQSANEELETSKEELQSMNEELKTVNNELQARVIDLEGVNNDITNLLSSTDIATLFLDAQMRIRLFTPAAGKLLSLIDADVGRPITDFSASVANTMLIDDARRVLADLTPVNKDVWTNGPERRCYLRRIVPYKTADIRIEGVVVTFVEITEQKASESALEARIQERTTELRRSRGRLQSIVSTVVDAITTIDCEGIIDLFNPAAERMFGYRSDEVIGKNVKLLMPAAIGQQHDDYLEAYRRTGKAKIIGNGREVVGRRKDGSDFPLYLEVSEIVGESPLRFVGSMRDLTEIQQNRDALAREHALSEGIVSTARAIILRLDQAGRIVSFNPYMEELSGYKLEEVRGADWFTTFIPERERKRIESVFERSIAGHRANGNINPILTKEGTEILVEWYDSTLDVCGEPFSLIAVGHDVTARDQLEREFLQAQKMEAVGRLAGGVAHDFNNLLAGILGGLRIASKRLERAHPAREMLDQVQEEVARGASLTRRLLDFSRVGKPKAGLIDPRETLLAGERMIRRLIGEDVAVQLECDDSHSRIFADPGQIEQTVLNLAINARDAMPRGGRLEIRCADQELSEADIAEIGVGLQAGPHVLISVKDTGCGMDQATQLRALEPFFTTKERGMGTGLGLASVAAMMERCHGQLTLESELEQGTTIRLYFPRASAPAIQRTNSPDPLLPVSDQTGETILLVEDETLVRLGVQHILEEMGYVVLAVKNPALALEELGAMGQSIDLLLSDVVLPGMSGPELSVAAQALVPGIKTLLMSAFPSEELVAQGRIEPGTITLEKPFTDQEVAFKVRQALSGDAVLE